MRRFLIISILAVAIGISAARTHAQEFTPTVRWFGDLRVRGELDMRDFQHRTGARTYTLLRTRFGLEATPVEGVRVFIQARDSRLFGMMNSGSGSANTLESGRNLDLHQGYVEVQRLFFDELSLRLGRQELAFANERIIGAAGWHNVGRSFDGTRFTLYFDRLDLDLFAMNVGEIHRYAPVATPSNVQYVRDSGQHLIGGYATLKGISRHRIDGYYTFEWDRKRLYDLKYDVRRGTMGIYAKGKFERLDYETEVAYQGGTSNGRKVAAYLLTGALGYSFVDLPLTRFSLGYDLLSGTKEGEAKLRSFDHPYATGHKFYGFMDYFISVPVQTFRRGLGNFITRATVKLSEKMTTDVWFHNFALIEKLDGARALGQEVDVVTLYRHNKNLSFELGVSAFAPARIMRETFQGSDTAFWGYLTTFVSF